ncbi:MAG: insulinase family protein, partial [Erysipelotrichales bacterium]
MKNYQIKKSNKFKTNYLTIRYVIPATKENATYSSLLSMYLMHANNVDRTYRESTNKLDLLYGSKIDINTALKGNEIVFDFIFSAVSMRYIKNDENYGKEVIDTLITYIKDPLINDGAFDVETFNLKKYELQKRIEGSYDDKTTYALEQFYHIFGNNYPLEVNVLGYLDILKDITKENLKDFYDKLIVQTPLISGLVDEVDYENINNILKHSFKEADFSEKLTFYNLESDKVEEVIQPQEIVQSKLVLGYYSNLKLDKKVFYEGLLFNALFGMSSNSYLFKKVREEANLCYTIRANYDFYSNSIFVFSG